MSKKYIYIFCIFIFSLAIYFFSRSFKKPPILSPPTENVEKTKVEITLEEKEPPLQKKEVKIDNTPPTTHEAINENISTNTTIGAISIHGNNWTCTELIKRRLRIKVGEEINDKKIQNSLSFLNLNPFRKVSAVYAPGNELNTADIELFVAERFPLRVYVGADNTGIKTSDRSRFFAGFNLNNILGIDSILSYQFTSSYDIGKFRSHTGYLQIFLPWKNILSFYGGYSQIDVEPTLPTVTDNKGFGAQASFRYNVLLPRFDRLTHNFIIGGDVKRTDTALTFFEIGATNDNPVNLTQLALSYLLNYNKGRYKSNITLELYYSPGEWISDQENLKYNALRTFAENNYIYGKLYFSNLITLPQDFLLAFILRAQVSNKNLLPSETLGVGGYDTVRGFYERELNGDLGIIINTEIRSPSFHILKKLRNRTDGLQFLVFLDYGLASIYKAQLLEDKTQNLLGYGPGIRYIYNPYITARFDLGFKGNNKEEFAGDFSVIHFGVNVSY